MRPPARIEPRNVENQASVPHKAFAIERRVYDSPRPSGDAANDRVPLRIYRKRGAPVTDRVVLFHHATYQRRFPLWEWLLTPLLEHVPVAMMDKAVKDRHGRKYRADGVATLRYDRFDGDRGLSSTSSRDLVARASQGPAI